MAPPPDDRARRTRPDEKVDATTKDAEANHARSQGQSVRESRRMSEAATRCNFLWHSLSRRPLARGGRRGLTNRLTLNPPPRPRGHARLAPGMGLALYAPP